MTLMGIDVGTTGCKVAVFSPNGQLLSSAYTEYDISYPQPGWAELDPQSVWQKVKATIAQAAGDGRGREVTAISVSSLGEAVVPVTSDRKIVGPSLLNFDARGESYLPGLEDAIDNESLYAVNGNPLGNQYGLTKVLWLRDYRPEVYDAADKLLPWSSFIAFMLGAEASVDYTLANRLLLFDLASGDWSPQLLAISGIERPKLPSTVPPGTAVGSVDPGIAAELGLPISVLVVAGAHDQCANAVGCGVVEVGRAVYGMGTFICITPVFESRPSADVMLPRGLNTEHHAVPERYVSFIYNQGGSLVKWYRDTFARAEHQQAREMGRSVYPELFAEMPAGPSGILSLPHFSTTGPPSFIGNSSGVIAGLHLDTERGAVLKGLVEGATFYLKESVDNLEGTGIGIEEFRAVGGGSRSDAWVQLTADILGRSLTRPSVTEAGALGAAIIAGVGCGSFANFDEGVAAMVKLDRSFEPDSNTHRRYAEQYARYKELWPLLSEFLTSTAST